MLVSVIIPVYNTEEYLERCLFSVINQTLKDIEIILINDGSTDKSYEICCEFSKKDSRITILNQENFKQGYARNRGLDIATGQFITFVDSDDYISKNYLELLYNSAVKNEVNMASTSIMRVKKNKIRKQLFFKESKKVFGAENITQELKMHLETAGKLYKSSLIKEIKFNEGVYYEDAPYTIRAIHKCNSMITVPNAYYYYVSRPNSTIKQKLNDKTVKDQIYNSLDLINYAEDNNIRIQDWCIHKEYYSLFKIKHYKYHQDYYLFGIKVFRLNKAYINRGVAIE